MPLKLGGLYILQISQSISESHCMLTNLKTVSPIKPMNLKWKTPSLSLANPNFLPTIQYRDKEGLKKKKKSQVLKKFWLSIYPVAIFEKNEHAESYWHDLKNPKSKILPAERKRIWGWSCILPMRIFFSQWYQ